ncbi:unnamed protein product [Microthlaspi erraticum]|uniref:Uncharacterized protein n=1 Tax=Microthlaspi erraticum TaxID=1685480 RepID=A0A6D2JUK6_9BRAS|nr:unnamed protein product [Microthlaspi erraticum]
MVYTRVGVWIPQCPPKNWELGRGLEMGDGHQEHSINWVRLTRSSLRLLFSSSSSLKCVWLPWPWWSWLLEAVVGVQRSERSPGTALIVLESRVLKQGLLQVNSTLSSIELSFLCLDSIESGGRAGASGLGTLPPSLRVVFSFPWLERRGSVRLLGREPPWSGEE